MKRSYAAEIQELANTIDAARDPEVGAALAEAVITHQPMVFVGSGGALAAARLAADLHIHSTGQLGVAMTPLEAATAHLSSDTGLVLITARGRNPDAALAVQAARQRGADFLGVVSARTRDELPPVLGADDVRVATISTPPDGFLATNSLIAMAVGLCSAHGVRVPKNLPGLTSDVADPLRRSCVVVTGPGQAAVGVDLEARLVETGLAVVQLADFRNLAHGRHVGLKRNAETSTIVAVIDPTSEEMAARTLALLPTDFDVVTLRTDLTWPVGVVDLLVQSIKLVAATGEDRGLDPGRPGVPAFGRKLYHLPVRKLVVTPSADPVERKLLVRDRSDAARATYESELRTWLDDLRSTAIHGLVLDYDGTVCATSRRGQLPAESVRLQILRLLDLGIRLGFATGRGKSLHTETRQWLPEEHWSQVQVGLYNGTRLLTLADEPPRSRGIGQHLEEAAERVGMLLDAGLKIEERPTQLQVTHRDPSLRGSDLLPLIRSVLYREPRLTVQVLASGHSVDILDPMVGKLAVVEAVESEIDGGAVLAIGDQGQVDGNDFQLLASSRTTLSVDRCSSDPTRCWNLDQRGDSGPDLLVRYLRALKPRKVGFRFDWKLS